MIFTSWNSLPSGTSSKAFITPDDPDNNIGWATRGQRIKAILIDFLESGTVVGMQGVDSFFWLLHEVRRAKPQIHGVWVLPNEYSCCIDPVNEMSLMNDRENYRTFESEYCPMEFAAQRCCLAGNSSSNPGKRKFHAPAGLALFWDSEKISVVSSVSAVNWYSWGITGYMSYGYSTRNYMTLLAASLALNHPLLCICVAQIKASNQSNEIVAKIVKEINAADGRDMAIILADTAYAFDEFDFVQASAELPSYALACRGELFRNMSNQIWIQRSAALHWDAVHSPSTFWTPPNLIRDVFDTLISNPHCLQLLEQACARQLLSASVSKSRSVAETNIHLNSIATMMQITVRQLTESLMCLQPNAYAPSVFTPASVTFIQ